MIIINVHWYVYEQVCSFVCNLGQFWLKVIHSRLQCANGLAFLPDLLLDVSVLVNVLGHQVEKLVEADAPVPVLIDLANHFLEREVNQVIHPMSSEIVLCTLQCFVSM